MVIAEALTSSPPAGWASLMAAVLLLSGVQLVILGIVGEYLGRLYLTANGKPQSVIKEVRRSQSRTPSSPPSAARAAERWRLLHEPRGGDLLGIAGQIALKSAAEGRRRLAQFLNPLTMIGLASIVAALCYILALEDPGLGRVPVGRGELCVVAVIAHCCGTSRSAGRSRRHRADRQRRAADHQHWLRQKNARISAITRSTASSEICG